MTAVVGIAAVAVIAVGAAGLRERWVAAERASVAERLGREVERIHALMRHAHMLPAHDIRPAHALVKTQIDRLQSLMAEAGPSGIGPGHYAIGRGYLALDEHRTAREHLQQAWQAGYRTPDTAYALGLALGALYQSAIEDARRLRDPDLRRAATGEAEHNLRDPALTYLKAAGGAEIDAPAYVEGLIAFYEQRFDTARQKAREALQQRPWLYEARRLDGDTLVVSGRAKQERGDHSGAMSDLEQAKAAYGAALDVARSDPALHEAECVRRTHVMEIEILRGLDPQNAFQHALAACDAALGVHPALGRVHTRKARIQWLWGDWQVARGQDPGPALEEALRAAERAVEADPRDATAHIVRGTAHRLAAESGFRRGVDPRGALDRAIESFERATAIDQGLASAHDQIGTAYDIKAEYALAHGDDPRPDLDRAIAAYQEAIRLRPNYAGAHHNLGYAFRLRGEYELAHGLEPASLARAAASFERAIEINPGLVASYAFVALICAHQAQALSARGADPTAVLARGRAAIQKGRVVNPKYVWLSVDEALIEIAAARWELRQGRSPEAPLDRAEAAAQDLLARNVQVDEVAKTRAQVYRWRAEWRVRQGRDPAREIAEGQAAAGQALKLSPRMSEALALQGTFRVLQARATRDASRRQEALRQARDLFERAFASNPLLRREYEPVVADAVALESEAGPRPRR